ncbi:MAG: sterol desaturase family protein [Bacteroidota bacterium]
MLESWLNTPNIDVYAVLVIMGVFTFVEVVLGHYHNTHRDKNDWIQESIGFFIVAFTKSILVLIVVFLGDTLAPASSNSLQSWPLLLSIPFYLLLDDVMQYWYHRLTHEHDWLWKHHRTHHAAEDMGIWVAYRNSWVYYLMMPNLWWAAIATYLGLAPAVIFGLIVKQIIITSSHSTWHWDEYFYKRKLLRPFMNVIERIFITPAFHHAHHGASMADHVSDPNGNFGNMLSIWDQLFGTAKFTRKFPSLYGLQTDPNDPWYAHVFYPFVKSPKEGSQIARNWKRVNTATNEPIMVVVEPGTHLFCQCGFSQNQPFCDGAHHGTKYKPLVFEVKQQRKLKLCNCKHTKKGPFCDNSHLELK